MVKAHFSAFNVTTIVVGLMIMSIGLYRTIPVTLDRKFGLSFGPIWGMFLILLAVSLCKKGLPGMENGIKFTIASSAAYLPIMVGYFLTMGFSAVVFALYREQIIHSLTGSHGYLTAFLSSFVVPSSTVIAPQMAQSWNSTAAARPPLILAFICMSLNSPALFYIRTMGMSWSHQWKMYLAGIACCLILTPLLMVAKALGLL